MDAISKQESIPSGRERKGLGGEEKRPPGKADLKGFYQKKASVLSGRGLQRTPARKGAGS